MNKHLADLWLLPEPELQKYLLVANKIAQLRSMLVEHALEPVAAPVMAAPASVRPEASKAALPQRAPMRPPKPGSLRSSVHDVLRAAGKPMRRSEIIEAVAHERGVSADERLKAVVSETLINRHDHCLSRMGHGIYSLAPTKEDSNAG